MSSELVKKLEEILEERYFLSEGDLVRLGFNLAIGEVKLYEAQQMKEPFYRLEEEQLQHLQRLKDMVVLVKIPINKVFPMLYKLPIDKNNNLLLIHAFTTWAIEQEKLEEDK